MDGFVGSLESTVKIIVSFIAVDESSGSIITGYNNVVTFTTPEVLGGKGICSIDSIISIVTIQEDVRICTNITIK